MQTNRRDFLKTPRIACAARRSFVLIFKLSFHPKNPPHDQRPSRCLDPVSPVHARRGIGPNRSAGSRSEQCDGRSGSALVLSRFEVSTEKDQKPLSDPIPLQIQFPFSHGGMEDGGGDVSPRAGCRTSRDFAEANGLLRGHNWKCRIVSCATTASPRLDRNRSRPNFVSPALHP